MKQGIRIVRESIGGAYGTSFQNINIETPIKQEGGSEIITTEPMGTPGRPRIRPFMDNDKLARRMERVGTKTDGGTMDTMVGGDTRVGVERQ